MHGEGTTRICGGLALTAYAERALRTHGEWT